MIIRDYPAAATAAGEMISALCGETDLSLTPFEHGADVSEEIHLYRVEIDGGKSFAVLPITNDDDCASAPDSSPQVYCTRSSQSVLPPD